jgi:predicted transcriptional regulator
MMKTNVSQTSLASFWSMRDAGELPEKERIVYEALIKRGPMTREQIAAETGMKEGACCGRVFSLMEKGMVEHHNTVENRVTGKWNEVVRIATHRTAVQAELELA